MFTFADMVNEVRSRVTLDKASTEFDTTIKNTLNTSLFRVARERNWRVLRRFTTFETTASYTTGTGAVSVTNGTKSVTVTGATFLTNNIEIGQRIDLGGSNLPYVIKTITGETTLTVDRNYDGTTSTTQSYEIFGKESYNLPIQAGRIYSLWHEDYGYPYTMHYIKDLDFFSKGISLDDSDTPICWRQTDSNGVLVQPKKAGVLTLASSSSSDTSINVTVYGTVSNYPDYETITTNSSDGTTEVSGTKSFDPGSIERIIKDSSSVGRLTLTADSGNTTVSVLPVGDREGGVMYYKVQIFPFPSRVFPINVIYYKDPHRLTQDRDVHELGQEFDEAIILLTCSKLSYMQSKDVADKFFALYTDEIKSLAKRNMDTILNRFDSLRSPVVNRTTAAGGKLFYSQLGGNYGPRV